MISISDDMPAPLFDENPPAVSFFVPGKAAPGGSKKAFAHAKTGRIVVTDDAKGNRDWKSRVADFAGRAYGDAPLLRCPLEVWATFYLTRPKGHYRTGRNAGLLRDDAPRHPTTKPDGCKLFRALEDACTGVIWVDDSYVVAHHVAKKFGDRPGALVCVRRIA